MRKPCILVTGGAGYIGSHAVLELQNGHDVVVLDNLSRGHRELVPAGVQLEVADLLDRNRLEALFRSYRFDAVMHFAAFAYVGESMARPAQYFRNNYVGTLNLLEAMRAADVRAMVFSSTCAVYGIPAEVPIGESAPVSPVNPYGESKAAVERLLHWYGIAYGFRSAILRYFNAAGADPAGRAGEMHDPEPHVIPQLLRVASGKTPRFTVLGSDYPTFDSTCVRDYIHVADLADAHVLALRRLLAGEESMMLNLGTGRGCSVRELIQAVERATGKRIAVEEGSRRPGDPPILIADARKAGRVLGWTPQNSSLDNIVASAWAWCHSARARAAAVS